MNDEKRMKQAYADEKKIDRIKRNQTYTPGPWKIGNYSQFGQYIIDSKDQIIIAQAHEHRDFEANVQLITAVTDLLEACKSAAMFIFELDKAYGNIRTPGNPEGMKEPFKSLYDAINKAEGN